MTRRSNMWHRQRIARAVLVCAKALLIGAVILLLIGYFGSHVRDAAGTVASAQLKPNL